MVSTWGLKKQITKPLRQWFTQWSIVQSQRAKSHKTGAKQTWIYPQSVVASATSRKLPKPRPSNFGDDTQTRKVLDFLVEGRPCRPLLQWLQTMLWLHVNEMQSHNHDHDINIVVNAVPLFCATLLCAVLVDQCGFTGILWVTETLQGNDSTGEGRRKEKWIICDCERAHYHSSYSAFGTCLVSSRRLWSRHLLGSHCLHLLGPPPPSTTIVASSCRWRI